MQAITRSQIFFRQTKFWAIFCNGTPFAKKLTHFYSQFLTKRNQ
jgi:hypothetical protein